MQGRKESMQVTLVAALAGLVLGLGGCAGQKAKLVEWRNDELTICCLKKSCDDGEWISAASQNCQGTLTLIGGKIREQVASYTEEKIKGDKLLLQADTREQSCRTFKCAGVLLPPK
jgi:hypothetical protein